MSSRIHLNAKDQGFQGEFWIFFNEMIIVMHLLVLLMLWLNGLYSMTVLARIRARYLVDIYHTAARIYTDVQMLSALGIR